MSWRELRVFLRFLPPDSATARAVFPRDATKEFWTPDRLMMAALIDDVRFTNYLTAKLHGDPKQTWRVKPPKPIPRPGVEPKNTKVIRFAGRHGSGQLTEVLGRPAQAS